MKVIIMKKLQNYKNESKNEDKKSNSFEEIKKIIIYFQLNTKK